jgi:glycosyltransferase involved in cell wall biosynthesis
MKSSEALHVAINVQVAPGGAGGIVQSTIGLIHALGKLDGPEKYLLIVDTAEQRDWLKDYCGPNQQIVVRGGEPSNNGPVSLKQRLKTALSPLRPAVRALKRVANTPRAWPEVPVSNGFIESLGCDVLHFPTQLFTLCALPTIYNPHDLQHLHFPRFFTPRDLVWRETIYPAACRYAHTVAVGTQWIKDDVIRRYSIDPNKVQVIPWASPTQFYKEPEAGYLKKVTQKYQLELPFALYPAVTWPHKNHVRLLEALAHLRDKRSTRIRLVCTGSPYESYQPSIDQRVCDLNLASQVKFLGFVPDEDLRALYRLAQFLILPTLYEADSCPIHEAWSEGLPVASSNATALPDQVHDAGLLFDPKDISDMANAIECIATSEELRAKLRERGYRRVRDFDWERTAKAYRAVYRRAADCPLTDEDRHLLGWDWMREPEKAMELARECSNTIKSA